MTENFSTLSEIQKIQSTTLEVKVKVLPITGH